MQNKQSSKIARLLSLAVLTLIIGCSENTGIETLGMPTVIDPDQTPVDVICEIQAEFRELKKPVLDTVKLVPADQRSMSVDFMRVPEELPAYYQFELHPHAAAWVSSHTSAEISSYIIHIEDRSGAELSFLTHHKH